MQLDNILIYRGALGNQQTRRVFRTHIPGHEQGDICNGALNHHTGFLQRQVEIQVRGQSQLTFTGAAVMHISVNVQGRTQCLKAGELLSVQAPRRALKLTAVGGGVGGIHGTSFQAGE